MQRLRAPLALAAAIAVSGFATTSNALTMTTFNACIGGGAPLGQADKIDGTGGDAIGAGSGAPYNPIHYDDAIVYLGQHFPGGGVDTAGEFQTRWRIRARTNSGTWWVWSTRTASRGRC